MGLESPHSHKLKLWILHAEEKKFDFCFKFWDNYCMFYFCGSVLAINGFVYRNLPGLTMCKGDKVTWHLSGLGSESDINSLYFEGNRFIYRQNRRDSISVFPHISHTVTMEPDSMGMHLCHTWFYFYSTCGNPQWHCYNLEMIRYDTIRWFILNRSSITQFKDITCRHLCVCLTQTYQNTKSKALRRGKQAEQICQRNGENRTTKQSH